MRKVDVSILLIALLFASCGGRRSADAHFQRRFNSALPNGTKCSEYHTAFENENDWVYAIEFQDEAQSNVFRSKWGLTKGISGHGDIFKNLKGIIADTPFEEGLLREGWSTLPQGYHGYEGTTSAGRESYVYLSGDGRKMLVFIPGG